MIYEDSVSSSSDRSHSNHYYSFAAVPTRHLSSFAALAPSPLHLPLVVSKIPRYPDPPWPLLFLVVFTHTSDHSNSFIIHEDIYETTLSYIIQIHKLAFTNCPICMSIEGYQAQVIPRYSTQGCNFQTTYHHRFERCHKVHMRIQSQHRMRVLTSTS